MSSNLSDSQFRKNMLFFFLKAWSKEKKTNVSEKFEIKSLLVILLLSAPSSNNRKVDKLSCYGLVKFSFPQSPAIFFQFCRTWYVISIFFEVLYQVLWAPSATLDTVCKLKHCINEVYWKDAIYLVLHEPYIHNFL